MLLAPFNASTHHWGWEATLEALDRVVDDHEVHKRDLPNVKVQVSLEDTLSVVQSQYAFLPLQMNLGEREPYLDLLCIISLLAARYTSRARSSKPSLVSQLTLRLVFD